MKKLLIMALALLSYLGLSAGVQEVGLAVFKKKTPYSESGIGFELINKANHEVWFAVSNGDTATRALKLDPIKGKTVSRKQLRIDINQPTQLAVWFSNPGNVAFEQEVKTFTVKEKIKGAFTPKEGEKPKMFQKGYLKQLFKKEEESDIPMEEYKEVSVKEKVGPRKFTPTPKKLYTFTPGKTIYLTWDKGDFARPQTGPLGGLLKKTDSNLSLEINVKKDDIKAATS